MPDTRAKPAVDGVQASRRRTSYSTIPAATARLSDEARPTMGMLTALVLRASASAGSPVRSLPSTTISGGSSGASDSRWGARADVAGVGDIVGGNEEGPVGDGEVGQSAQPPAHDRGQTGRAVAVGEPAEDVLGDAGHRGAALFLFTDHRHGR